MAVQLKVPYTYLNEQFAPDSAFTRDIMRDVTEVVSAGDFTLGKRLTAFEEQVAEYVGVKHAIGVASGTDALFLIFKALGMDRFSVGLTAPNTFIATVGAMIAAGMQYSFADIDDRYLLPYVSSTVEVVVPVHWGGDMHMWPARLSGPDGSGPWIVEDACQAMGSYWAGHDGPPVMAGAAGIAAAFSLHPLKNVNIWGDGGVVTTNDDGLAQEIRLLRNHGLEGRDKWLKAGYNSRLDTVQAVVASHGLTALEEVLAIRTSNARRYDEGLRDLKGVVLPPREEEVRHSYHLYQFEVEGDRDGLLAHLQARGIEAKVHYPVPLHLQPALEGGKMHAGDFPRSEAFADNHLTLPVHQGLTADQLDYTIEVVRDYLG